MISPACGQTACAPTLRSTLTRPLGERETVQPWSHSSRIDPTRLSAFVRRVASSGDRDLYEQYRNRTEATTTPEGRYWCLYALANFRDPELLRYTFEYAQSPKVRTQDASLLISRLLDSPAGPPAVWPLIQTRRDRLSTAFGAFGGRAERPARRGT
jgi:hypothetical protein